jgi:hypothetical protein
MEDESNRREHRERRGERTVHSKGDQEICVSGLRKLGSDPVPDSGVTLARLGKGGRNQLL